MKNNLWAFFSIWATGTFWGATFCSNSNYWMGGLILGITLGLLTYIGQDWGMYRE